MSGYQDSCANQKGCTDCDGRGYKWCKPTNGECSTVARNANGTSRSWFQCEGKTIFYSEQRCQYLILIQWKQIVY